MFAGFADDERIKSNDKNPNPNVTVLEFLNRRPGFEGRVSAVATWDVFPAIINTQRSGVYVHAGIGPIVDADPTPVESLLNEMIADAVVLWPNNQLDTLTMQIATEHIRKRKPRVLFIGMGEKPTSGGMDVGTTGTCARPIAATRSWSGCGICCNRCRNIGTTQR